MGGVDEAGSHGPPHHLDELGPWLESAPTLLVVVGLALAYVLAAARAASGPRGWSRWRTAACLFGCGILAVALFPLLDGHGDPRAHMARHVLLGMIAPLGLVLAAPFTLLLRVANRGPRRWIGMLLRSRAVRLLGHPATAAALSVGALYVVMLTSLYPAAETNPVLHHLLHLHYLVAGYLFTWSIVGPDPAPRRPGMSTRLTVLIMSTGAHAVLAKVIYAEAGSLPMASHHDAEAVAASARLMYYGGDLAEVRLATALFTDWYRTRWRSRAPTGGRRTTFTAPTPPAFTTAEDSSPANGTPTRGSGVPPADPASNAASSRVAAAVTCRPATFCCSHPNVRGPALTVLPVGGAEPYSGETRPDQMRRTRQSCAAPSGRSRSTGTRTADDDRAALESEANDYAATDVGAELPERTGGRGLGVCIEAVGMEAHSCDQPTAARAAIHACRKAAASSSSRVQQHGQRYDPMLLGSPAATSPLGIW